MIFHEYLIKPRRPFGPGENATADQRKLPAHFPLPPANSRGATADISQTRQCLEHRPHFEFVPEGRRWHPYGLLRHRATFKSQRDFGPQPKVGAPAPTLGHHPTIFINPNGVAAIGRRPRLPAPTVRFNRSPGQRPGTCHPSNPSPEMGDSNHVTLRRAALHSPPQPHETPPQPNRAHRLVAGWRCVLAINEHEERIKEPLGQSMSHLQCEDIWMNRSTSSGMRFHFSKFSHSGDARLLTHWIRHKNIKRFKTASPRQELASSD
jgi:hypothetical protein